LSHTTIAAVAMEYHQPIMVRVGYHR